MTTEVQKLWVFYYIPTRYSSVLLDRCTTAVETRFDHSDQKVWCCRS